MKLKFSFVLVYCWIFLLGVLGAALLLLAPADARASEYENRMLAARPVLSGQTLSDGSYMTDFETYLADAVFARDTLISVSNEIRDGFSTIEDAAAADEAEELVEQLLEEPADEPEQETVAAVASDPSPEPDTASDGSAAPASDDGNWRMYMINPDGTEWKIYTYPEQNVRHAADVLNAYRKILPEDGNVYFYQVPFAATAHMWTDQGIFIGWRSTVEDGIAALVDEGVRVMNTPAILTPYMLSEQMYFFSDHHWTPRAASHAVDAGQELNGLPTVTYDEYSYQSRVMTLNLNHLSKGITDKLEVLELLEPAESWLLTRVTEQKRQDAVIYDLDYRYMAFLNGMRGPWRRLVTGYHTGRRALIISDSYGTVYSPYLFPYYDEVFMTDFRGNSYSAVEAGGTARDYIKAYGVDDVYVVLSTASGINSPYMLQLMMKYY